MFEITTYLVPWFFTGPIALIGMFVFMGTSIVLTMPLTKIGNVISKIIWGLSIFVIIAGFFFLFTHNTEIVDNPNSVTETSKNSIAADEEEIVKKIEEELNVHNVSLEQDQYDLTRSLVDGNGVGFTAVNGAKAIDGIIHFTNDEMVLTVFNEADETVVIPTR